ncbi:MAG: 2-C-methyl-D-erythritol 4-phosphate cytidylyltransferase [Alloprevotella sp.]
MNIAVILAAGSGRRMQTETPKQFLAVGDRCILAHTVAAFETAADIAAIVIVTSTPYIYMVEEMGRKMGWKKVRHVIAGGKQRADSTQAALRILQAEGVAGDSHILFHDAARMLVTQRIIADVCRKLADGARAVNVLLPVTDTIVELDGNHRTHSLCRSRLRAVQTPQGFRLDTLAQAYRLRAAAGFTETTDDCGVVERFLPETEIAVVDGDPVNLKVTTPMDLTVAAALLSATARVEAT